MSSTRPKATLSSIHYAFYVHVGQDDGPTFERFARNINQMLERLGQKPLQARSLRRRVDGAETGERLADLPRRGLVWFRRWNHDCIIFMAECHEDEAKWPQWLAAEHEFARSSTAHAYSRERVAYLDLAPLPRGRRRVEAEVRRRLHDVVMGSDQLAFTSGDASVMLALSNDGVWVIAAPEDNGGNAARFLFTFERGSLPVSLLALNALRRGVKEVARQLHLLDEARAHAGRDRWLDHAERALSELEPWVQRARDDEDLAASFRNAPPAWSATLKTFVADAETRVGEIHSAIARHKAVAPMLLDSVPKRGITTMANERYDIAIVCALPHTEFETVLRVGALSWVLHRRERDPTPYQTATYVTTKGRKLRVIAAAATQKGMPTSAVLATKMILQFQPALVAMVGIAAGVDQKKQGFGDILAPDQTFDYASGKITLDGGTGKKTKAAKKTATNKLRFQPEPNPRRVDERIVAALHAWSTQRTDVLDEIRRRWPDTPPPTSLKMHVGPLGSGPAVVAAREPIEDVVEHWRQLKGIEMEAYGVHLACESAADSVPFLCMKSICDFAAKKGDRWQKYAAYTAAELCYRFLIEEWESLFPSR